MVVNNPFPTRSAISWAGTEFSWVVHMNLVWFIYIYIYINILIYIYISKQKTSTARQKPQLHHRGLLLFGGFNTSGLPSRSPPRLELMLSLAIIGGHQKLVTHCSGFNSEVGTNHQRNWVEDPFQPCDREGMPKTPNIGPGMPATGAGKQIIGQKVRPGAFDDDDFWQLLLVQNKNQVMFSVSVRAETSDSTEKKTPNSWWLQVENASNWINLLEVFAKKKQPWKHLESSTII